MMERRTAPLDQLASEIGALALAGDVTDASTDPRSTPARRIDLTC
jgi:hypothetical protein